MTQEMPKPDSVALLWYRRDLRLRDHPALTAAVESGARVIPVYILDDETPGRWRMGGASRWWLAQSLRSLDAGLKRAGSRLTLRRGAARQVIADLIAETGASAVYFTRGYEPFQRQLEEHLKEDFAAKDVECRRFGGQILFEPEKVKNKSGEPFRVYTPFYKTLAQHDAPRSPLPVPPAIQAPATWPRSDALEAWDLEPTKPDWAGGLRAAWTAGEEAAQRLLQTFVAGTLGGYHDRRNVPGVDGTSRLSPHLAFGEISPRQVWSACATAADIAGKPALAETYLKEIAWREFSYHLLFHFPTLPEKAFKPEFEAFPWSGQSAALKAWQQGRTGYPIVDAGMRQLWQTGWMHNRVRMIVASFLIKHLLVSWQTGEDWFWDTLVDADLASNAASWQWVAGSGADAAPYFRIFNPVLQSEKFDPEGRYVREFCPELAKLPPPLIHKPWEADPRVLKHAGITLGATYPSPIVDHGVARQRALAAYERIKKAS